MSATKGLYQVRDLELAATETDNKNGDRQFPKAKLGCYYLKTGRLLDRQYYYLEISASYLFHRRSQDVFI